MVKSRLSPIAAVILDALDSHPGHHFTGARTAREHLLEARFDVPSWEALANGLRPDAEDSASEPGVPRHGWQCKAMRPVNERFLEGVVQPRLLDASRALLRSQSGPFASLPFTSFPFARYARFDPQPFRVLLLRRLWFPLPLSSPSCRCGRPLDSQWPPPAQRAPWEGCWVQGVSHWSLPQRGFAGKQAAVCPRMSESRTWTWQAPNPLDNRRIEVVVDGLPLFHGAQLAVDTTLVSPLRWDGTPHPRCANVDGAALDTARRRKETTYPELHGRNGRTRLVVLGAEVGGRWSDESAQFVRQLAKAKARGEPPILRSRAQQAWTLSWSSILACSAAKSLALSLLGRRGGFGADGATPSTSEVIGDAHHLCA